MYRCVDHHEYHQNADESFSIEHGKSSRESVAVRIDAAKDAIHPGCPSM